MSEETKEKHEIDRIAEELNFYVVAIFSDGEKYGAEIYAVKPKHGFSSFLYAKGETETEAKDALLAKLQEIVCPDYAQLKKDLEEQHEERHLLEIQCCDLESELGEMSEAHDAKTLRVEQLSAELEKLKSSQAQQPTAEEFKEFREEE